MCESHWAFKLTGLQMEEITPTYIPTPSKPTAHIHLLNYTHDQKRQCSTRTKDYKSIKIYLIF